jgi:hypothetical protein
LGIASAKLLFTAKDSKLFGTVLKGNKEESDLKL